MLFHIIIIRKPNIFYQAVEMWYPETNRLDVFSRETRDGWDHWGDQIGYFDFE